VLCSRSSFTIDDFLAFDYIGAPWVHADHIVGNGGLSLRSVDKMMLIAKHFNRSAHPEDVFFVEGLADLAQRDETVVRASTSVAEKFSWEMQKKSTTPALGRARPRVLGAPTPPCPPPVTLSLSTTS